MSDRQLAGLAAAGAIAVHARTIAFGFTGLDDRDLLLDDHAFLARPANLVHAFGRAHMHVVDRAHTYYRPVVTLSYGLDAQWSGLHPGGYHATNVGLHAIATALVYALLRRFAIPPAVAFGAALVFAVHPTLAAAVAWIPGRNDSLLAVFGLAAWLFLARDRSNPSPWDRALHFACFALALLTKETALALPAVWLTESALFPRGPRRRSMDAVYTCGWAALVCAHLWLRAAISAAPTPMAASALWLRAPLLVAWLGKVAIPFGPTVMAVEGDVTPWLGLAAGVGLGLGAGFVAGARPRVVVFGVAAFVLLLVPVLALPGTLVLDSRLYLPACGIFLALAEIVRAASATAFASRAGTRLVAAWTAVLVLSLAVWTAGYEGSFRDAGAFAREAVSGSPHSPLAHFCLGQVYQTEGRVDRALAEYSASLTLGPGEVVHNNVAVLYMGAARWADAERELREELALNPRYARAYANLAIVLSREGREEEARESSATARALEAE